MAVVRAAVKFGTHHPRWKSSLVVAIPKPNKPNYSSPKAHRPIQLIECLGKLVEKIVAKRLLYDAGRYNLMPHNQFGGRFNASCLDVALALQHDIFEARRKGLVSSFLAMDIRGFFDHVNHDRMIHVLWKKGFPKEICKWVKSFLSDRTIHVHLDNYTSPRLDLKVGVPQGSPVSPSLACLYASEVLERFNANPILSGLDIPCGARAYIDDFGFLAISDSLHDNTAVLKASMTKAVALFSSIGMSLDPDKSDLMHFLSGLWFSRPIFHFYFDQLTSLSLTFLVLITLTYFLIFLYLKLCFHSDRSHHEERVKATIGFSGW